MPLRALAVVVLLAAPAASVEAPRPAPVASAASATAPPASASPSASGAPAVVPATGEERTKSLAPKPAVASRGGGIRFVSEPLGDAAVFGISLGFFGLSEVIIGSGELKPQQPAAAYTLNSLDRVAVTQTIDPHAAALSNYGLWVAALYAVADPVEHGLEDHHLQSMLVDVILYGESAAITGALTNLAKLAIRRPRPRAYAEQQQLYAQYGQKNAPDITDTDAALSFFSGHAALAASLSATAVYLAFARSPHTIRPWLTLLGGVLLTSFVSYERVRSGAHFPTDVIAGALVGGGVGVLVPHMHREQTLEQRPVWIGFGAPPGGLTATATFTL